MRKWTLGERQFGTHIMIPLLVDGRDYGDLEAETDDDLALARFIVDACNAAEEAAQPRATLYGFPGSLDKTNDSVRK